MNLQIVLEKFSVISNIDINDCSKWIPLCKESINEIKNNLRSDVDENANAYRLETAAAALSLYKYALYSYASMKAESFSAGELKIKIDPNKCIKMAQKAWIEARNSISDLLKDESFVFERITY